MASRKNRKLINYLINRDVQIRILVSSFIFMFLTILLTLTVILYPFVQGMISSDSESQYRAAQSFLSAVKLLIPMALILFLLYAAHIILLTHKVCGPLVNFGHTFVNLKEGNLTRRVQLRRGDYLEKECNVINEMITNLSSILITIKERCNRLNEDVETLAAKATELNIGGDFSDTLERMVTDSKFLHESLTFFQTEALPPKDRGADEQ